VFQSDVQPCIRTPPLTSVTASREPEGLSEVPGVGARMQPAVRPATHVMANARAKGEVRSRTGVVLRLRFRLAAGEYVIVSTSRAGFFSILSVLVQRL
jgi:hypothetical protein